MRIFGFLQLLIQICLVLNVAAASDSDIQFLRTGVNKIGISGVPGPICVFGEEAFAVIAADMDGAQVPLVAAANFGEGRIVAFGHGGYLNPETLRQVDTLTFFRNCIDWAAHQRENPSIGVFRNQKLVSFLVEQQLSAVDTNLTDPASVNVLIIDAAQITPQNKNNLQDFIADGGGLIAGGLGWGWKQLNPGKSLTQDFAGNQLLEPMGLVWADGYTEKTCPEGYLAKSFDADLLNASKALALLIPDGKTKTLDETKQISTTLTQAIRSLPENDTVLLPKIQSLQAESSETILPTPQKPLNKNDIIGRLLVSRQVLESQQAAPADITAHPAAHFFPGEVPADAPRIRKTLTIDTSVPRWHSTGLYAVPGEKITVHADPAIAGKNLSVRIGAHTDTLWHHDQWKRCPQITRSFAITQPMTGAANAFGGLVYIDVPENCALGAIKIDIEGAIEAPLYVKGITAPKDWKDTVRNAPGPWAELATDKMIVTVPSANVRQLDDPAALMGVWDSIMDACADLAAIDHDRKSPERIVADVQISVGYMHSGYPIMVHADQYANLVNRDHLLKGNWGLFHEIGHNHQRPDWTFEGTGEVTVNLFTTYVFDTICGVPPGEGRVDRMRQRQNFEKYAADGYSFEQWKKDPFLALVMYLQLQEQFGWEAFKKVFAEYHSLTDSERPKTDADKRNQWMVRFSNTVGRNLGPFFDAWNVPVSEDAKKQVAHLPVWLPVYFKTSDIASMR
jgi:hypothetical protein